MLRRNLILISGGPQIILSGMSLPAGSAANTAVGTLSVKGGKGTYTFSLTGGATTKLKVAGTNGVNLQAAAVATAGTGETLSITVKADNGAGSVVTKTFSIIAYTNVGAGTVTLSGSAVQGATLTATASGSWTGYPTPSYTYQWVRGAATTITGATSSTYVVQAADNATTVKCQITGSNGLGTPANATSGNSATITKTTLTYSANPSATVGSAYTGATPSTAGGTSAYVYTSTALPAGLSISSSTGIISGTPTTAAATSITLTVADANGVSDSSTFTLTVAAAGAYSPSLDFSDSRNSMYLPALAA